MLDTWILCRQKRCLLYVIGRIFGLQSMRDHMFKINWFRLFKDGK